MSQRLCGWLGFPPKFKFWFSTRVDLYTSLVLLKHFKIFSLLYCDEVEASEDFTQKSEGLRFCSKQRFYKFF